MMLASFINDPEHWLERAQQMRNLAGELDDRFHETGSNGTGRLSRGFLVCA